MHPAYEPFFSRVLIPGDRVTVFDVSSTVKTKGELVRNKNGSFGFGRFHWPTMATRTDARGRSERGGHFETRLRAYLNWQRAPRNARELVSALPLNVKIDPEDECIRDLIDVVPQRSMDALRQNDTELGHGYFCIRQEVLSQLPEPPFESICRALERKFEVEGTICACCMKVAPQRCQTCRGAVGWHRCDFQRPWQPGVYHWKPGTLSRKGADDVRPYVRQMLATHNAKEVIAMLEHMRSSKDHEGVPHLSEADYRDLTLLAHEHGDRIVDSSPMFPFAYQQLVRSHNTARRLRRDRATLDKAIEEAEQRMQSVWDSTRNQYVSWQTAGMVPG